MCRRCRFSCDPSSFLSAVGGLGGCGKPVARALLPLLRSTSSISVVVIVRIVEIDCRQCDGETRPDDRPTSENPPRHDREENGETTIAGPMGQHRNTGAGWIKKHPKRMEPKKKKGRSEEKVETMEQGEKKNGSRVFGGSFERVHQVPLC